MRLASPTAKHFLLHLPPVMATAFDLLRRRESAIPPVASLCSAIVDLERFVVRLFPAMAMIDFAAVDHALATDWGFLLAWVVGSSAVRFSRIAVVAICPANLFRFQIDFAIAPADS